MTEEEYGARLSEFAKAERKATDGVFGYPRQERIGANRRSKFHEQYLECAAGGMSVSETAKRLGVSRASVSSWSASHGVRFQGQKVS